MTVAALDLMQSPDASTVPSGTPIGFTVTLANSGDGDAAGLSVDDPLPGGAGLEWALDVGGSESDWSVTGSPPDQHLVYTPDACPATRARRLT